MKISKQMMTDENVVFDFKCINTTNEYSNEEEMNAVNQLLAIDKDQSFKLNSFINSDLG